MNYGLAGGPFISSFKAGEKKCVFIYMQWLSLRSRSVLARLRL
jgi:hypothetical protein